MSVNGSNRFLNIEDANLRVRSGNVHAKGITVGGITVGAAHGLQSVSNVSNTTSNTLQFTNATTSFKATSNIEIGGDVSYTSKPKISVESNVVAEYTGPHDRPLRKYPEVAITQNDESATSGYVVSATSVNGAYEAWKTFSAYTSNADRWQTSPGTYDLSGNWVSGVGATGVQFTDTNGGEHSGEWIKMQLPKSIKLDYIRYLCNYSDYMTKDFVILGSNDDTSWTLLKSVTGGTSIEDVYHTLHINADGYYNYYVWLTTAINGDEGNVVFNDISFYGHEEGSGSLDTTLKSVYNVPATTGTQLEVYYDGQDYTGGSTITDKVANADATISSGSDITFDSTYKAWVFGGDDSRTQTIRSGTLPTSLTGGANAKPEISAALWFNPTVWGDDVLFMITDPTFDNTENQFLELRLNAGQNYFIQIRDGQYATRYGAPGFPISSYDLPANNWYHLVVSMSGKAPTERKMYLNGIECTYISQDIAPSGVLNLPVDSVLELGRRPVTGDANTVHNGSKEFFGSIANFRLYSKALNAEQIQELYDYQKDYFLGSKSQVTLYKGNLGVGVTEPSGQLELAGDERIQEYPPRGMTGFDTHIEGHGVFKASASSQYSPDFEPWGVFSDTSDYDLDIWVSGDVEWYTSNGYPSVLHYLADNTPGGAWLKIEMPYKIKLNSFSFVTGTRNYSIETFPENFQIWASNNGTEWNQIYSVSGFGNPPNETGGTGWGHTNVNSQTYYSMYAMVITKVYMVGSNREFVSIPRWKLFGTPGPTTLDKGSLSLTRSLDVPRVSRYDVDTETPRPEKLVVDFDTTVNSSPTDISGKGNHMTFHGNARYSEADKAFVFDGTTGTYMSGTQNLGTGTPAHTITGWFKRTSTLTEYTWIFTIGTSATGQMSGLLIDPQGDIVFDIFNHRIETQKRINNNEWYHFAGVFHGASSTWSVDTCDVYINGVLEPTQSTGTSPQTFNLTGNQIYFGTSTNFLRYSSCLISNFKLYNVALEPSEVKKLYNLGRTGRSMVISDTAVGIGKVPEAQLDVRGNIKCDGVIKSNSPAFSAYEYDPYNVTAVGYITLGNTFVNKGGCYDTSTGIFTTPITGTYYFTADCIIRASTGSGYSTWTFHKNNANFNPTSTSRPIVYQHVDTGTDHQSTSGSLMIALNAGDTFRIKAQGVPSNTDQNWGQGYGRFMGYLIS